MAWPSMSPDLTPMDFFPYGHIKALIYTLAFDSEEDLIASIVEGSNLAYLSAHVGLCCVVVGRVSRSVAVRLNICSKLKRNTTLFIHLFIYLFQNTSVVLLDFQPQSDQI
jgi:hypothetical protein